MEIKIGRSTHTCGACEADFVHEQEIHSLVRVVEGQFAREDYCESCWGDDPAQGAYSTWHAHYYDPRVAEQEPEETFSPLRQTFYEAAADTTRSSFALAYLSAQLLRRQKVFRLIKETKDPDTEASVILFNDRIASRLIEVNDPNLSHAELEAARLTLMDRLTQLEAPEPEPEEEVSAESESDTETSEDMEAKTDAITQDPAQV